MTVPGEYDPGILLRGLARYGGQVRETISQLQDPARGAASLKRIMSIPYPRCGNDESHPPHPDFTIRDQECPGWTADQQLIRHLITSVREYAREHYLPGVPLPAGLRLEMHPDIRRLLMLDPDLWDERRMAGDALDWFPVPAKVTRDLKPGQWRLVIVTEEVLLDSSRPHDLPVPGQ